MAITVGTWNLENLFCPGGPAGPSTDAAYTAKLEALATTIRQLAPDVLAVQEVGDPDPSDRSRRAAHRIRAHRDRNPGRTRHPGRVPIPPPAAERAGGGRVPGRVAPHPGRRHTPNDVSVVGRAVLTAQVETAGHTMSLVTCHLKSRLLTFPGGRFSTRDEAERARFGAYALYRRAAEAVTVRAVATELLAGEGQQRAVLVPGDLNDEPDAATTQILHGPPGSEIGTGGYDRPDHGDGQRLWNLAPRIPEPERYSRIYRGRRKLIDHILASHQLTCAVTDMTTGPEPASIGDNPTQRRDSPGSDHRPVVATILA
jgi:endonuclease/exonuclease/phosphatase family metal-dependent hydrolase